MKLNLAQIPEEGLQQIVRLRVSSLPRLAESLGAQEGPVEGELTLRNHHGNVEVRGRLRAVITAPCQRCLEPVEVSLEEDIAVSLAPLRSFRQQDDEIHLSAGDLEVSFYEGDEIDVARVIEDELLLAVPETVAPEDDEGRCVICGRALEDLYAPEPDREEDHPFAQLKQWIKDE